MKKKKRDQSSAGFFDAEDIDILELFDLFDTDTDTEPEQEVDVDVEVELEEILDDDTPEIPDDTPPTIQ